MGGGERVAGDRCPWGSGWCEQYLAKQCAVAALWKAGQASDVELPLWALKCRFIANTVMPRFVISTKTLACMSQSLLPSPHSRIKLVCKRCEMPSSYCGFCHLSRTVVLHSCLIADDDVRC